MLFEIIEVPEDNILIGVETKDDTFKTVVVSKTLDGKAVETFKKDLASADLSEGLIEVIDFFLKDLSEKGGNSILHKLKTAPKGGDPL